MRELLVVYVPIGSPAIACRAATVYAVPGKWFLISTHPCSSHVRDQEPAEKTLQTPSAFSIPRASERERELLIWLCTWCYDVTTLGISIRCQAFCLGWLHLRGISDRQEVDPERRMYGGLSHNNSRSILNIWRAVILCLLAEFPEQLFCSLWVVCWLSASFSSARIWFSAAYKLHISSGDLVQGYCADNLPDSLTRFDHTLLLSLKESSLGLARELWNAVRQFRSYVRGIFCRS